MGRMTKPSVIKQYTEQYKFYFKKDYGQNFLIDDSAVSRIVDAIGLDSDSVVLEIGPGVGALTELLVEKAERVIAVEIDPFAVKILHDIFSNTQNLEVILADVLKTDLHKLLDPYNQDGKKLYAVSNLPYYITSPVIMKLLETKIPFESIVVMMQKEVSVRMGAKPGSKDYSAFSVVLEYYADAEKVFDVSRNCFMPSPNVDSSVVRFVPKKTPPIQIKSEEVFFKTVHAAFAMRRKTMLNCISAGFSLAKEDVRRLLQEAGIEENSRAETIDINRFGKLSDLLSDIR